MTALLLLSLLQWLCCLPLLEGSAPQLDVAPLLSPCSSWLLVPRSEWLVLDSAAPVLGSALTVLGLVLFVSGLIWSTAGGTVSDTCVWVSGWLSLCEAGWDDVGCFLLVADA